MKSLKKTLVVIFINLVVLAALLEIIARLLPVQDATNVVAVSKDSPYIHLAPNRVITNSFGPRMEGATKKRVNNYGYFSDFDYQKSGNPLAVVIGDSYVEAMQVSNADSLSGQLDGMLGNQKNIYNIGFSGSPLSQYLAFAKFAQNEFSPQNYVFLIISNDFDESLLEFKNSPGFFYYNKKDELELVDYEPSTLKVIARSSAFLRYLFLNFHIQEYLSAITIPDQAEVYYSNTIAKASASRIERSKHAVDLFIRDIKDMLGTENVLFVLDADRRSVYKQENPARDEKYYSNNMFEYFKSRSLKNGFRVLDLQPDFYKHFGMHGKRFESTYDAHWNEIGHQVAAKAIFEELSRKN